MSRVGKRRCWAAFFSLSARETTWVGVPLLLGGDTKTNKAHGAPRFMVSMFKRSVFYSCLASCWKYTAVTEGQSRSDTAQIAYPSLWGYATNYRDVVNVARLARLLGIISVSRFFPPVILDKEHTGFFPLACTFLNRGFRWAPIANRSPKSNNSSAFTQG